MRIAVFGAGGVGGYFGGRLAQAGEEVIFIARGEHLHAIQQHGLQVESPKGNFLIYPAQATSEPVQVGVVDVVLVGVKAWQVPQIATTMRPLIGESTIVVPLQNGVEAPAQLAAVLGSKHVLGGLCRISALIEAPGRIRHAGVEPYIAFGNLDGRPSPAAEQLRQAFVRAGVWVEIPADIQAAMWEKFLFIAPISGVGSVARLPVGAVRSLPGSRWLLQACMQEVYTTGRARGIALTEDSLSRTMALVDGLPDNAIPSMQRDILDGKPSELEYQNGAVVRMTREMGAQPEERVPVNTFIYYSLLPQELHARGELPARGKLPA